MKTIFNNIYNGKTVLVTGDTGFKGSWLAIWLLHLGANVVGYSLKPKTEKDNYVICDLDNKITHIDGDIRDYQTLLKVFLKYNPEIVFHLAAQSLVLDSYKDPILTYSTNVMGTVNLFEVVRHTPPVKVVVNVTSDKCYANQEWIYGYREMDPIGGKDPYSASKACAEIVTASYRSSFLSDANVAVASARAGNVIGGGDWAEDRLLPDCIRAFTEKRPVELRYPHAIRPWQHVLEPLYGYILLAGKLLGADAAAFSDSWNFGPDAEGDATVGEIARKAADYWGSGAVVSQGKSDNLHEAGILRLDITKARTNLNWRPRWPIDRAVKETISWYKAWHGKSNDMHQFSLKQIESYEESA